MIPIKSRKDLEMMRAAGGILAKVMGKIAESAQAGVTTRAIDTLAEELIRKENCLPAFKGYKGFPATVCASVNEQIVHGIPDEKRLKEGDIVSLDLGLNYQGYFSDIALTVAVGKVSDAAQKLIETTRQSLCAGVEKAAVGNRISDISAAIQDQVEKNGFSVVRQFVGHGIGRALHEEPEIPNFRQEKPGALLKAGMVLAIEPMVNAGTWECRILKDGWTAVTRDGMLSAHFEHTVAVTENGPEILTR
jgi:methionyl aminopeptidase